MKKIVSDDAREFGQFVKTGGSWHFALLVARNTFKGAAGRPPVNAAGAAINDKVSMREFAERAGVSDRTIRGYRQAWEDVAATGKLPSADTLKPGDEVDFSKAGDWPGLPDRRTGTTNRHVSDEDIVEAIKAKPQIVEKATTSEPKVASAALKGLRNRTAAKAREAEKRAVERGVPAEKVYAEPEEHGDPLEGSLVGNLVEAGLEIQIVYENLEAIRDKVKAAAEEMAAVVAEHSQTGDPESVVLLNEIVHHTTELAFAAQQFIFEQEVSQ